MSQYDYDLFVIGAGSGGVRAARIASTYGAKVAIAEEHRVGGTCVIRGCVPKKLMVYASHFSEYFEDAAGYGWSGIGKPTFDWKALIANKDAEIDRLNKIYITNLDKAGVEIHHSRAEVVDAHTVKLTADGKTITAERILIATGGTPTIDHNLPGFEHTISSNEVFYLDELPKRVVVVGGGYIAVEFAGIFQGLGARTTLVYRGEEILRGFDNEVRTHLRGEMEAKGINVVLGDTFTNIEKKTDGLHATTKNGDVIVADQIMMAIGRVPAVEGLGLENAGVDLDRKGAIKVDAYSQTNVESIYAVGDVTNRVNLTPVAIREGHAFADTVYGGKQISVDHGLIPTAVFSQPEIGTVGMSEEEAIAAVGDVNVYASSFRPMKNILPGRSEKMLMKLIVDANTDKVLGCHVLGPDAGEMAQLVGISLKMGATKADFDATMAVHPTASEELVTMRSPTREIRK